jgi:hypothetical protein
MLNAQCSMLNAQCPLRNAQCSIRLDLKSSADPSEAAAESINGRDWHDPQPHHEQDHIGARNGVIAVGLKNSCKCQDYNRPKNRSEEPKPLPAVDVHGVLLTAF